ncbi:MAG: hypothetical protein HUJ26_11725 [Planctomycetaceae bacterium]|nr:hypothetical protein [Planctomycetaceae bacterium]
MTDPHDSQPEPEQQADEQSKDEKNPASEFPSATNASDDLPEEFELTPELVEEEAIRGDFVLRWAVVLLAVLLGCTVIAETETLVHVKSGQYLASHGFFPDGTDPFAYTTEGRDWRNQAWLLDLVLAGVFGIGGAIALSVFKALLSGVVIWAVVTISRPRTPTWWNAITAVVGLIALIPFLTATPELITLLGCALTLRFFFNWRYQKEQKFNWKIPVLFLVWANADPRMFLGLVLLLLLAVGEMLRRQPSDDVPLISKDVLWKTVGAALAVSLINPFGYHSWLSAVELYSVSDPLIRDYYGDTSFARQMTTFPIWSEMYWDELTIPFIACLSVGGLILAALFLNYDKLIPGEALAAIVFTGLAAMTLRDAGPAIVVGIVVISLNCQDWYRASFKQEYTVNKLEILFSRGGRALTVLSFMAVAWLGMTGLLYEGSNRTIGFGFENVLDNALVGMREDLKDSYDNRPFNYSVNQGDTLIWADQKVFIDNRLALFTGTNSELKAGDTSHLDLIKLHGQTRQALRQAATREEAIANDALWKQTFETFEITHALPRVSGRNPDYVSYTDLMLNPSEFVLTKLTPTVAVFYRQNLQDKNLTAYIDAEKYSSYLAENRLQFVKEAFGEDEAGQDQPIQRVLFPQPESAYVSYLTADREEIPRPLVLSRHYLQHIEQSLQGAYQIEFRLQLAFSYLAIRNANYALAENPDSSQAFLQLGKTYYFLGLLEQRFCSLNGINYDLNFRFLQAHLALNQALIGNPDYAEALEYLRRIATTRQKFEPALRYTERILEMKESFLDAAMREEYEASLEQLQTQVDQLYDEAQKQIDAGTDPLQVAVALGTQGAPYRALEMLESDDVEIPPNSQVEFLEGIIELEAGRAEEAYNTLLKLEPMFAQFRLLDGYRYATLAALGHADYASALDFKERETIGRQKQGLQENLFMSIPLSGDPEAYQLMRYQGWEQVEFQVQEQAAYLLWMQAVFLLESGENAKAEKLLSRAMEIAPNAAFRPMLISYLTCVARKPIAFSILPPAERIPIHGDMFAEDPEPSDADESKPETPDANEKTDQ